MQVSIAGFSGSIGRRYAAILDFLGHEFCGWDKSTPKELIQPMVKSSDAIIIATPTHLHLEHLDYLNLVRKPGVPILCEKPVCKEPIPERFLQMEDVYCVNQYNYVVDDMTYGPTYYDYYRSGPDGLIWDCFQIIGLANSDNIKLQNKSPVWTCMINGHRLNLSDLENAYVHMIMDLLGQRKFLWDMETAAEVTQKVIDYEKSLNSNSSQNGLQKASGKSS